MIYSNIEIFKLFLYSILFGIGYFFLYRKSIFSIFDPLNIVIIANAVSSMLVIRIVTDYQHIIFFFLFQLSFLIGIKSNCLKKTEFESNNNSNHILNNNLLVLEVSTLVLFIIFLLANTYAYSKIGIPLLSNSPSLAKATSFVGGMGIVRRINWGVSVFILSSCLVLTQVSKYKNYFYGIIVLLALVTLLGGSKSSLLIYVFAFIYFLYNKRFNWYNYIRIYLSKVRKYFLLAVVLAMFIFYRESDNILEAFSRLFYRVIMYGEVVHYYYKPYVLEYFKDFNLIDFIKHESNPILGFFRLTEYNTPLSYKMVNLFLQNTTGQELKAIVGPNTTFFVESHIYFGYFGGIIYSFLIGYIISFFRKMFFNFKGSLIKFSYLFTTVLMVTTVLATESSLCVSRLFDAFFIPSIIISLTSLFLSLFIKINIK